MTRLWSRAIGVAAFTVSCAGVSAAQDAVNPDDARQLFDQRVAAYVELQQRVNNVFPPWQPVLDMHLVEARRHYLASAIQRERRDARQGNIFDPVVATVVRGIIAEGLRPVDVQALLRDLYEECDLPIDYRPQVNAPYPYGATHEMPSVLLSVLPALPSGIYYRLVDHDLLLWDGDANLIIDVLPEAVPRAGS